MSYYIYNKYIYIYFYIRIKSMFLHIYAHIYICSITKVYHSTHINSHVQTLLTIGRSYNSTLSYRNIIWHVAVPFTIYQHLNIKKETKCYLFSSHDAITSYFVPAICYFGIPQFFFCYSETTCKLGNLSLDGSMLEYRLKN